MLLVRKEINFDRSVEHSLLKVVRDYLAVADSLAIFSVVITTDVGNAREAL